MTFQRRIGRGAGPNGLNLRITEFKDRTDFRAAALLPDTIVWRIKDVFTTHFGSWEVVAGDKWGIDQWARDAYIRPVGDPFYNDDAGADHHMLTMCMNLDGVPFGRAGFAFTSDGPEWLQSANPGNHVTGMEAKAHGWANVGMFKPGSTCYPPDRVGPWSVAKNSSVSASDIITGMGLPLNEHVSTFIVWQGEPWKNVSAPVWNDLTEALQTLAARYQLIQFNPGAALQKAMFADGFVPNSGEFDFAMANGTEWRGQRAENVGTGEARVYACKLDDWENVIWVPAF